MTELKWYEFRGEGIIPVAAILAYAARMGFPDAKYIDTTYTEEGKPARHNLASKDGKTITLLIGGKED